MNIINGWHLLDDEVDLPIIQSAEKDANTLNYKDWHDNFIDDIIELYTPGMNRRVALDLGGNVGMMAVPLSKYYEKVFTFEISPVIRECLKLNTEHYSNIEVMDCGTSDHIGLEMFHKSRASGTSRISDEGEELLPVKTIDSFNFNNVDLIKIDVERHEYNSILGAAETINRCSPIMIIEIHSRRTRLSYKNRQRVMNLMYDLGYYIVDVRRRDYIWKKRL